MSPVLIDILIFFVGVIGAFVGSVAAGSGLITMPILLFLGIPPQIALGSFNFGSMGTCIGNIIKFSQLKNLGVLRRDVLILTTLAVPATVIGSIVVVSLPEEALTKIVGIILLVLLPLLFAKKDFGVVANRATGKKRILSHVAYTLVNVWSGFFSPGTGLMETYIRVRGYGYTIIQGKAVSRIPILLSSIGSVIVFAISGFIKYDLAIILFLGMLVGGYLGTTFAIKKGDAWLKPLLGIIILATAIKLILFS
jgi:uncharacterized membrane protein YfcA